MVTKQTASNNSDYLARFAAIGKAIWNDESRINSLEEYFANIEEIAAFALEHKEYTGLCLAMPVDEPVFEIDANSRIINIPAEFKKNGVAVLGDHNAETIYFAIDKYFDYQSFAALTNDDPENSGIRINWTFIDSGKKAPAADAEVQTAAAFGPSENLIPGKLVFGWVIEKEMTKKPGTLLFSVEFYAKNVDNSLDYSFNTLTAQLAVGNALTLKDPAQIPVDKTALLLNRLRNTPYRTDAIEGPAQPSWIDDLPEEVNMPFDGDNQDTLVLHAQAGIEKGKSIQYVWESSIEGEGMQPNKVNGDGDEYLATEDLDPVDGVLYYAQDSEHPEVYVLLAGTAKEEAFAALKAYAELSDEEKETAEAPAPVFERFNKFEVNKAGVYRVRANAKVDISDATSESLSPEEQARLEAITKYVDSKRCVVPAATEPVVSIDVSSRVEDVELINPDDKRWTYVKAGAAPEISIKVRKDAEQSDKLGSFAIVMLDAKGKIVGSDVDFAELNDAAIVAGSVAEEGEEPAYSFVRYYNDETEEPVAIPVGGDSLTAQGQYRVGVINRLNNTYAKGSSEMIETSFVAPLANAIGIEVTYPGDEASSSVLVNGKKPNGTLVQVDLSTATSLLMVPPVFDEAEYPDCVCTYTLEEVQMNAETNEWELVPEDAAGESFPSSTVLEANNVGNYFLPLNAIDNGYYRIKAVSEYHNTKTTGYTELFRCIV
jgi:hypothetical protein